MSQQLVDRLFHELESIPLIDPHTHINPHAAASKTLADILGYHYYTELAHSAGMPRERIEEPGLDPKEKVRRLVEWLGPLENTIQSVGSWRWPRVLRLSRRPHHARQLGSPLRRGRRRKWPPPIGRRQVLEQSRLERSFSPTISTIRSPASITRYVPCLRTDDLVFHLAKPAVRQRLAKATGIEAGTRHAARRSANCSITSRSMAPGPARFRFLPISSRRRSSGTRSIPPEEPAPEHEPSADERRRCRTSSSGRWPNSVPNTACRST